MTDLKATLFPDTNITGKTDRNNQPILVGQTIKDETGAHYTVCIEDCKYVVKSEPSSSCLPIGLFMALSEWVEIVVPAVNPDKAAVAMAPFDKEHNAAVSFVDEIGTLPNQNKLKSISTRKTHRRL